MSDGASPKPTEAERETADATPTPAKGSPISSMVHSAPTVARAVDADAQRASSASQDGDETTDPGKRAAAAEAADTRVADDPRAALLEAPTRVSDEAEQLAAAAPASDSTGLRPFDTLGAYQILRRLGGGGMAEVYLARAKLGAGVEKLVAIKTARPAYGPDTPLGALFLNEAKVSASLQHPSVVQVFDFGEAAGRPYLAMEYLHGRELYDVLARVNEGLPLPVDFVVSVLAEVCDALEYLHTQRGLDGAPLNLVHRDVSPSNVLITDRGQVKLMDFGVAASQDDAGGLVVGKHAYMSPEQAEGAPPSPRWDVFAVGSILAEFLSRSRFGPTPTGGPVEALADLEEIARRAMAPDPRRRIGSASELGDELRRVALHLDRPDVGRTLRALFGPALEQERTAVEHLVQEGRRRAPDNSGRVLPRPLRTLVAWRRRIASTRWAMQLNARPALRRGLIAAAALLLVALTAWAWNVARREQAVAGALQLADLRILQGRLVGPGGDHALDHLRHAGSIAGGDPRVARRLEALAATFERLGDAAVARGDHAEAAVHLQAALEAAPGSASAKQKLAALEAAVRDQARERARARGP